MKGKATHWHLVIPTCPSILHITKENKSLSLFEFHQRYLFIYKGLREK